MLKSNLKTFFRSRANSGSLPPIASRQAQRNNNPAATPEEYFRTTVGISLLDTIIMEIETRFNPFIVKSSKFRREMISGNIGVLFLGYPRALSYQTGIKVMETKMGSC